MISLVPLNRLLVTVAVMYAATVSLISGAIWLFAGDAGPLTGWRVTMGGATILNLVLLSLLRFAWQPIWGAIPFLNRALFPNLNGVWNMEIHWNIPTEGKQGVVNAKALIKQDLMSISMEVTSPGSDSETLIAHPKKDPASGRPLLFYVYRVVPKDKNLDANHEYRGSALLKFSEAGHGELSGNYFTDRLTKGHFSLTRARNE
ncbi:hypothetical protein [Burkholderia anthina]|uniref:Cap15 family cyclic dinucleotide receptor domain-containing protein n=1 Tax=Burkholderia anthina TaxID=179879 RepID=UPI001ABA3F9F